MKPLLLLAFFVAFMIRSSAQVPVYRNLVFEGGGIRGIAYAGALTVIEKEGILSGIERTGGTSVGAIAAMMVAVGYTASEIKTVMEELKLQEFNDGQFVFFGGFYRFFHNYGWYRGARFERWLGKLIEAKTGNAELTFQELHLHHIANRNYRDLFVTGTNLTTQRSEVFSWASTPDMPLKTAVRISMSIPLYFSAVLLDSNYKVLRKPAPGQYFMVMIDGGVSANYPIFMFDGSGVRNKHTLGLKLERPEQLERFKTSTDISAYQIRGMSSYVGALYNYIIEQLNRKDSLVNETGRTIYISTQGIKPKVKKMKKSEKELLYNSGRDAATLFFSNNKRQ